MNWFSRVSLLFLNDVVFINPKFFFLKFILLTHYNIAKRLSDYLYEILLNWIKKWIIIPKIIPSVCFMKTRPWNTTRKLLSPNTNITARVKKLVRACIWHLLVSYSRSRSCLPDMSAYSVNKWRFSWSNFPTLQSGFSYTKFHWVNRQSHNYSHA